MSKVNLDALIPREDFFNTTDNSNKQSQPMNILNVDTLQSQLFIRNLRKPDFQRETNEWDNEKICDFIESFIDGELVPAIILWEAPDGKIFVIDGSHRLSALLAWIRDDYGDGEKSQIFYNYNIPEEQKEIAIKTRKIIDNKIGPFLKFKNAETGKIERADKLWSRTIILQWVSGDMNKAESSFFKINELASPINETEKKLLKSRKKPNCISARAIIKSGTGHKYWSNFSNEIQNEIQEIAKDINDILFLPKLQTPTKTLDIPIGGPIFKAQTLPLVFEFINIVNNIEEKEIGNDIIGSDTIQYLKNTRKIARIICSEHVSSLGLHPVVYFYSQQGRHKPVSFYSIVALVKELDEKNKLSKFISIREKFEKFILENDDLVSQISRKKRSGIEAFLDIKDLFLLTIEALNDKKEDVFNEIIKNKKFNYLKINSQNHDILTNAERKSSVFIQEALKGCPKCKICNGYLHRNSMSMDHVIRKEDGGGDNVRNLQLTHPYCNTGVKN